MHGSRRESESFRKASGSFSFGNREPLLPPPPRSNRYFPRRENDSGFSPSSFPRSGSTLTSPSLRPRNCDRSKTNGVPAFIDSKLDLSRPKIDRAFRQRSNLSRSFETRCGIYKYEDCKRGFIVNIRTNIIASFFSREEGGDGNPDRVFHKLGEGMKLPIHPRESIKAIVPVGFLATRGEILLLAFVSTETISRN